MAKQSTGGDYVYEKVLGLIDYCGDIVRNRGIEGYKYNKEFSPNNIKRLVIGVDGAIVDYHISTSKNNLTKHIQISPSMYQIASNHVNEKGESDYQSMLGVLYSDRLCASIEEVVICTAPVMGVYLNPLDMEITSMLKNAKSEEDIKSKYKRLRCFTKVNISVSQMVNYLNRLDKDMRKNIFIADVPSSDAYFIRKDDWYLGYGSVAQFYEMDAVGGKLNNYFKSVIENKQASDKEAEINKLREERVKGFVVDYKQALYRFIYVRKCRITLSNLLRDFKSGLCDFNVTRGSAVALKECKSVSNYNFGSFTYTQSDDGEKEKLIENTKALKQAYSEDYVYILDTWMTNFGKLPNLVQDSILTVLEPCRSDFRIKVPEALTGRYGSNVSKLEGVNLSGGNMISSVSTLCVLISLVYTTGGVSSDKIGKLYNAYNKHSWESMYKKEGER